MKPALALQRMDLPINKRLEERCREMRARHQVQNLVDGIKAQRKADPNGEQKVIEMPARYAGAAKWSRAEVLGLANPKCTTCLGRGNLLSCKAVLKPCRCVLRTIFRICLNRFRDICYQQDVADTPSVYHLDHRSSPVNKAKTIGYSRPYEEFLADMHLIARRTLNKAEMQLFIWYHLHGVAYDQLLDRLNVDRGQFFHMVYRVEEKLGLAYRCTEPYPLFPLNEYFGRSKKAA